MLFSFPGGLFFYEPPLFGPFWAQKRPQELQKKHSKTLCGNLQKRYPKVHQNDSKMTPQIHPGSSKMSPQSLTIIDPTHFGAPSGSQTTPSAPQASPGVPRGALLGTQRDPNWPESTPWGAKATSPGMQNHPLGAPWVLWVLLLLSLSLFFFFRLFFCLVPLAAAVSCLMSLFYLGFLDVICSSLPRALDSATHRHNCSQTRAGGMRGAIE